MKSEEILKVLVSKNNELESMKKYITDEVSLNLIRAKQDTIDDIYKMIKSSWITSILSDED